MNRIVRWSVKLSAAEYVAGLSSIREKMTSNQMAILRCHYASPNRTNYAKKLAKLAGIETGHGTVNLEYWRLAEKFCDATGCEPDLRRNGKRRWWTIWSQGYETKFGFLWEMLPPVAEALEILGWNFGTDIALPDENPFNNSGVSVGYYEGAVLRVTVNRYERDKAARQACIEHFKPRCAVCEFDFAETFGDIGVGFIHVHHLLPMAQIGKEYRVDPTADLRPVCPNCHAMLHIGGVNRTIDELREIIADTRATNKAMHRSRGSGVS